MNAVFVEYPSNSSSVGEVREASAKAEDVAAKRTDFNPRVIRRGEKLVAGTSRRREVSDMSFIGVAVMWSERRSEMWSDWEEIFSWLGVHVITLKMGNSKSSIAGNGISGNSLWALVRILTGFSVRGLYFSFSDLPWSLLVRHNELKFDHSFSHRYATINPDFNLFSV